LQVKQVAPDSGGFGFTPTLPASVEDTYHELSILVKIKSVCESEVTKLKIGLSLKECLIKSAEEKESWTLRKTYHCVFCCAFAVIVAYRAVRRDTIQVFQT